MKRRLVRLGVVGLLAASVFPASGPAAPPAVKATAAGAAAARRPLIVLSDLGQGWKPLTKVGRSGLQLDCSGFEPSGRGIVEIGAASSPDFSGGAVGPFVLQQTSVYASAGQASTLWKRAVKPGLIACVVGTLDSLTAKGIEVKVLAQGGLSVQKAGSMTAGYRVVADLYSPKTKRTLKTYFDVVLVGRGPTISEITFSTFQAPVPTQVEAAFARLVYHNIG